LSGVESLVDPPVDGFQEFRFVGYLVSPGADHAAFLASTSPLPTDAWLTMLPPVPTPNDLVTLSPLDVQVWSAQTQTASVTYFYVERQVRVAQPRSCTSHHLTGWFLPDRPEPVSVGSSEGDCGDKLWSFRRPLGLLVHGERAAVAVAPYGYNGASGMELWEVVGGEVRLVAFAPAM
jgi:hypothetical protein